MVQSNTKTQKYKLHFYNKHAKTNLNLCKHTFKNCSHLCAYCCAQLSYTEQHRTVLIIFPLNFQTITITQMLSSGGEGVRFGPELLRVYAVVANSCCPMLSQFKHTHLSCRLFVAILRKYDVIHRPEVHNVSQSRQTRTEPRL